MDRLKQMGATTVKAVVDTIKAVVDIGGRQFFLCFNLFGVSSVLFAVGTLSEAGYLSLSLGGVVAYIVGNQFQEHTAAKKAVADAQAAP